MIETVPMYRVLCDGCGACAQGRGEYWAWAEPDQAWMEVEDDWQAIDGKHYCDNCWTWDEERDEPVPGGDGLSQSAPTDARDQDPNLPVVAERS